VFGLYPGLGLSHHISLVESTLVDALSSMHDSYSHLGSFGGFFGELLSSLSWGHFWISCFPFNFGFSKLAGTAGTALMMSNFSFFFFLGMIASLLM